MFTGLVEGTGRVVALTNRASVTEVSIATSMAEELHEGESIAVDGACLTVIHHDAASFRVEMTGTTLNLTTLDGLKEGQKVNLERALRLQDRLGGHMVAGHVDGVGRVISRTDEGETTRFWFEATEGGLPYLVERGSIAVSGVSLTVVAVDGRRFAVTLIPTTLEITTLGLLRADDRVNLEYDLVAKYIWRWASSYPAMAGFGKGASA